MRGSATSASASAAFLSRLSTTWSERVAVDQHRGQRRIEALLDRRSRARSPPAPRGGHGRAADRCSAARASSGRVSVKSCIRSISAAMRSTSVGDQLVSARRARRRSPSSCAAPRMPDSGFLISCASIAAAPTAARAPARAVRRAGPAGAKRRAWCSVIDPPAGMVRHRRLDEIDPHAARRARSRSRYRTPRSRDRRGARHSRRAAAASRRAAGRSSAARTRLSSCSAAALACAIRSVGIERRARRPAAPRTARRSRARDRRRRAAQAAARRAPGRVEFGEHRQHARRVGLLVDRVAELGRAGQALGVPADMLARHVDAGLVAIMVEHRVVMLCDHVDIARRATDRAIALAGSEPSITWPSSHGRP